MREKSDENGEVYNHYLELSKPTQEDFERIFTDEELKELCLKHKCRVDMYRWNVVNDYRILFTESGRYQRWSERDRLGMLAKAVNKMKPSVLYGDDEIIKTRKEEWGIQLKENILSLNFWHRKRTNNHSLDDDIDREVQSQCEINTESMNSPELRTQSECMPMLSRELDEEVQLEIEVNTESMNVSELMIQSQRHLREFEQELHLQISVGTESMNTQEPAEAKSITDKEGTPAKSTQSEDDNILLACFDEEYLTDENSRDSIETVLHNEHQRKLVVESLHSEEVAPEIENIYGINTMSMTIGSQMSTQDLPILQSQDVIPPNYDNFKNIIPLTSTQSQESGGIIMS